MVPFFVIISYELEHTTTQRRLPDENHPLQAFLLDRTHEARNVKVHKIVLHPNEP